MQFPNKKEAGKDEARQQKAKGNDVNSFCAKMLAESGLTFEDVTANVYNRKNESIFKLRTFRPGTLAENGTIDPRGDDVIIEYYDLEGMPVTYARKDHRKKRLVNEKNTIESVGNFLTHILIKTASRSNTNLRLEAAPLFTSRNECGGFIKRSNNLTGSTFRKVKKG